MLLRTLRVSAFCTFSSALVLLSPPPASAQQAASTADDSGQLEEVVVTATKRGNQNLQDVPIAITAQSQATLESKGAADFADFARSVPSLSFVDSGPGDKTYVIRGVNSTGTGVATVGQYVDDILVTGDLRQPDLRLYDVQRVEVLRGPQGTLYGSGSLSGTIRTIVNPPELNRYGGSIVGRVSNTEKGSGNYEGAATLNAPLIADKLAMRVTAYDDHESGFIDNVRLGTHDVNEESTHGGRGAILYQIGSNTSLTGNVMYQRTELDGRGIVTTAPGVKYNSDQYVQDPFVDLFKIVNLTLAHDFGRMNLLVTTSYFNRSVDDKFDSTPFDLSFGPTFFTDIVGLSTANGLTDQYDTTKFYTTEVRLASQLGGRTEFVVGLFQQKINTTFDTLVATSSDAGFLNDPVEPIFGEHQAHETKQYALFGELSFKLTDKLTALVGARAFYADQSDDRASTYPFGGFAPPSVEPTLNSHAHKTTPKVYLSYEPTPDRLLYGSVSQGFRIGGGNLSNVTPLPPEDRTYDPDSLWAYELGAKQSFLDRRLIVNASVYELKWSNIQVTDFTDDTNALTFLSNAGSARVYGAELEVEARPARAFTLGGTLAWVKAELTEDQPSTNAPFAGHDGDLFPHVPHLSGSVYAQYERPLTAAFSGVARLDYSHTGAQGTQFARSNPLYNTIPAYDLVNLRLGMRADSWEATLYGRNLTNEYAANIIQEASDLTPRAVVPLRPRTVGVEMRYRF
ncbi:MAG: TonB-dependent receptor [Gammaproteobacteria bacterium]